MAKQAYIEGFFPEVKGRADRVGRGRGSTAKAAISRAIGDLLKQVKGKRIQTIKATITVTEVMPEEGAAQ
jgi:hypothetical protein